jgi:hypothetical protein
MLETIGGGILLTGIGAYAYIRTQRHKLLKFLQKNKGGAYTAKSICDQWQTTNTWLMSLNLNALEDDGYLVSWPISTNNPIRAYTARELPNNW